MSEATFKGLKLRNVGPAFTSGRIADIAIHPEDDNQWYVAIGSGGVWKTKNAGVTWETIFALCLVMGGVLVARLGIPKLEGSAKLQ